MSQKRDANKVLDVLEKMHVLKKVDGESLPDSEVPAPSVPLAPVPEAPPAAPPKIPAGFFEPAPFAPETASSAWDTSDSTDQYLDAERLYDLFRMKSSGIDTIYLIESYISTLPETLPAELRRSIILKIIAASGFDFDRLLNDGIDRVSRLNEYSTQFAVRTEEIVERHNVEIDALERQMQQIREVINERKNLHKRQFLTIESEAQRLKEILDFITK